MRQIVVGITFVALLVAPAFATAGTVTLTDWTTPGDFATNAPGGGGAFQATTNGGPLGNRTFLTFCLEFNEHFGLGGTYNYTLSDRALNGGVGPAGDPISNETRWLYYQAVTGGYTSSFTGIDLTRAGWYIQEAIWWLEGERSWTQITASSQQLVGLATTQAASWNLGGSVMVMNLTDTATGARRQDQLVMVPEPGTLAQLLAVGPFGLIGYLAVGASRMVRRRPR